MPTRKLPLEVEKKRKNLKKQLVERGGCENPNCVAPFSFKGELALHECLVPFNSISNVKDPDVIKHITLSPVNCMLLHNSSCHTHGKQPSVETAVEIKSMQYGQDAVINFFNKFDEFYKKNKMKTKITKPINL